MSNRPRAFCYFCICDNFQCGVQNNNVFIPALGASQDYMNVCPYVCLSVSISGNPRHLLAIIHMDRNCVQRMQPQAMGSNTLSCSTISLSVRLTGHQWFFCDFGICINFHCGDSVSRCIYPHTGVLGNPVMFIRYYMSVCISVLMSGCPRRFLSIISVACNCDQRMRP